MRVSFKHTLGDLESFKSMTPDSQSSENKFVSEMNPFNFFDGKLIAYGAFIDRSGKVRRRFSADIIGTKEKDTITLDEHFIFDDGEHEHRIWVLYQGDNGMLTAKCDDVVGIANGQITGPTLHLKYDFLLNISGRNIKFRFDDKIICQDSTHAVNKARVSKFGIHVGDVIITFEKLPY